MRTGLTREFKDRRGRLLPFDLVAITLFIPFTYIVVFLPVVNELLIRVLIGLVFVLFIPGYALVAALFPEAGSSLGESENAVMEATEDQEESIIGNEGVRTIDGLERIALSFGLSLALVPLLMLGLTISPFEFTILPTYLTISAATFVCAVVATVRRWRVPKNRRFRVPYRKWIARGKASITDAESRSDAILNVLLAASILLAVGTLGFAVAAPPDGERYTEFYVMTENDDGELVNANHPETLSPNEPVPLFFGIENYEEEPVEYTIIVQLQRTESAGNESVVVDRTEVDRYTTALSHNETVYIEQNLTVSDELTGEDLRLTFLLYDDSVPDNPTRANAYRSLHLWVDVDSQTG